MGRSRCSSEPGSAVRRAAALLLPVLLATGARGEPGPPTRIAIVVGATSPIRDLGMDTLRELYLRRQRLWPDGERAMPVNLPADSALRHAFSRRVLGRLPQDLVGYWHRRYFEGVRPPLVLRTSRAVCAYVAVERAAVGYVRPEEADPRTCRVLFVLSVGSDRLNPE